MTTSWRTFVAAVLLTACVANAWASRARELKQIIQSVEGGFAAQPVWPYCRCKDYHSGSNPYTVKLNSTTFTMPDGVVAGEHCFTINYAGPRTNPSPCYTALEANIHKFYLAIQPACPPAFDVTEHYITVNGLPKKGSSWEIDSYAVGSVLKLTKLGLNSTSAQNAVVCIRAAFPCHTAENFFDDVPVKYTFIESSAHACCVRPRRG